jgi:hypothetical protein
MKILKYKPAITKYNQYGLYFENLAAGKRLGKRQV